MTLPAYLTQVMLDSPVGLWALTDPLGSTVAADINPTEVGPTFPGAVTGGVTFGQTGPISVITAAGFNGSTGIITIPAGAWDPSARKPFTLEVIARPVNLNSTTQRLMGREPTGNHGVFLFIALDNTWRCLRGDSSAGIDQPPGPVSPLAGRWDLVIATYDGTLFTVYVNGAAGTPSNSTRLADTQASSMTIGKTAFGGNAGVSMSVVAAYNYALTAAQVANHYNAWQGAAQEFYLPFPAGFQPWDVASFASVDAWYTENYQGGGAGTVPPLLQDVIVGVVLGGPTLKYWALPSAINPLG